MKFNIIHTTESAGPPVVFKIVKVQDAPKEVAMAEKAIEVPVALELADGTWIRTETTIGDRDLQARVRREMRLTKPEWDDLEAYWRHHSGKPKSLFKEEQEHIAAASRARFDR